MTTDTSWAAVHDSRCRFSTAAPAMWPAAEHDPWGNAAAANVWPVKLTWKPRCAWIELSQCVLAMHTLTSLQERTSPGSGTFGTEHSQQPGPGCTGPGCFLSQSGLARRVPVILTHKLCNNTT
eukprot:6478240-Amphidinium_carterae.1